MDQRIPFLIFTDAPDKGTGLARICRDLATLMTLDPTLNQVYRIGTLGFFGQGSAQFSWPQYMANSIEDGTVKLQAIWEDFTSIGPDSSGVLFTITPPTWIFPIVCPDMALIERPEMKETWTYLLDRPFDIWSYFAIESHSPNNTFSKPVIRLMENVNRALFYSHWGADLAAHCLRSGNSWPYIPHGIYCDNFSPPNTEVYSNIRKTLNIGPDDILIGCVATNTSRKNLGLLFESLAYLKSNMKKGRPFLWLHTDIGVREWSLPALMGDLDIIDNHDIRVTSTLSKKPDHWMANMMGSCDVFTLPTEGEGFGYPLIEALASGTPIVTNSFGAQTQFLEKWHEDWICPYVCLNIHGTNNLIRPAYRPIDFARCILKAAQDLRSDPTLRTECSRRARLWDWMTVWPHFRNWLIEGVPYGHPLTPKLELIETKETPNDPIPFPTPESRSLPSVE